MTFIADRLPLNGIHRDSAGNLVGTARAARTGVQIYSGYEVGRPELGIVRVYRPEGEVFHRDSLKSFAGAPVTIEHPRDMVTVENWKDHAVGETASDDIVRDGESVKVPFIIRDAKAIAAIEDGKHEVSMGYTSALDFTAGQTPSGEAYDAVQKEIRINHLAIVDKARAGPEFRIGDNATQEKPKMTLKTVIVDGLPVETTDAGSIAIDKLTGERTALTAKLTDAETQVGTLTGEKAALAAKVTELETELADAASPEKLNAAAALRANLITDAKRVVPTLDAGKLTDAQIKRAVVDAKLGDVGKALSDGAALEGAFASLVALAPAKAPTHDSHRVFVDDPTNVQDAGDLVAMRDAAKAARAHRLTHFGADAKAN